MDMSLQIAIVILLGIVAISAAAIALLVALKIHPTMLAAAEKALPPAAAHVLAEAETKVPDDVGARIAAAEKEMHDGIDAMAADMKKRVSAAMTKPPQG